MRRRRLDEGDWVRIPTTVGQKYIFYIEIDTEMSAPVSGLPSLEINFLFCPKSTWQIIIGSYLANVIDQKFR